MSHEASPPVALGIAVMAFAIGAHPAAAQPQIPSDQTGPLLTTIENYAGERIAFLGESVSGPYVQVRSRITTDRRVEISIGYHPPSPTFWRGCETSR